MLNEFSSISDGMKRIGFTPILGTTQILNGTETIVCEGVPSTWFRTSGFMVVYDEHGAPWVRRNVECNARILGEIVEEFNMRMSEEIPFDLNEFFEQNPTSLEHL